MNLYKFLRPPTSPACLASAHRVGVCHRQTMRLDKIRLTCPINPVPVEQRRDQGVTLQTKTEETRMLNRIFPERIDNHYRGHKFALWVFVPLTFMQIAISLVHIFYTDGGAQSISTIPLDTYATGAAQNVIALLDQLLLGLLFVLVLFRYRAMIPLMYVLIVVHYIAEEGIVYMKPLALAGTSGASTPALVLTVLSIGGLVLSLLGKGYLPGQKKSQSA